MNNVVHCCDCMELMKDKPDKFYDLAIVDPPYGTKKNAGGVCYKRPSRPNSYNLKAKHKKKKWDNNIPEKDFFIKLRKISKNQIICGGNYYPQFLKPSMGWIYWGKMENESNYSDGELLYTSFQRALKSFYCHQFCGTRGGKDRIHPTQKPVALYKWLLQNYAKPGWKIFDSHVGSGSLRIACHDMGFDFVGCELDPDYWQAQEDRFKNHIANGDLWQAEEMRDYIYQEVNL